MKGNIARTSQQSLWQRLSSLLAKVMKNQVLLATVIALAFGAAAYLSWERGTLRTHSELLQKRLNAEEGHKRVVESEHSQQIQTYELRLKLLEKQLDDERVFHDKQIQWLNALMAIRGGIPASVIERFNSASQHRIAQR